jgi:hypothetical protein
VTSLETKVLKVIESCGKNVTKRGIMYNMVIVPKILREVDVDNITLGIILNSLENQKEIICHHHSVPVTSNWQESRKTEIAGLAWPPGDKYPIVGAVIRSKE